MPAPVISVADADDLDQIIHRAATAINAGQIVILPTETVYGAAVLLTNESARNNLRALPPAISGKPLIIHLALPQTATRYLPLLSDLQRRAIRKLWPGPIALVFDVPAARQSEVAADLSLQPADLYDNNTITLRCPDHPLAREILAAVNGPVVLRRAADADPNPRPALDKLAAEWSDSLALILDAGPTRFSKPSTIVKVHADRFEILRPGVYDHRIIERMMRTTLLFVCSGNTCRSPMAEAIARQLLIEKLATDEAGLEEKGIVVTSAGSFAFPGAKATPAAVDALKSQGVDLSKHRSKPLTIELIHQADAIYTMSRGHLQVVQGLVPSAADKAQLLDPDGDIPDPIGGDVSIYRDLAAELKKLIDKRLNERPIG